jgi:hypothetical protein
MGGAAGWDGAIVLHLWQVLRLRVMSAVMPGQNTEDSALDSIEVTP